MNSNIIFLILYIFFAIIIYFFFFFATKAMFDGDNLFIEFGKRDEEILKLGKQKERKVLKIFSISLTTLFCVLLVGTSVGLLIIKASSNPFTYTNKIPLAIISGSMEDKDKSNEYLIENNLNNQFPTGSLIFLEKVPDKSEIQKYDIIAYKTKEGVITVHRIISLGYYDENNIWTPTDDPSKATHYVFRGDNNDSSDGMFISYDQLYGKYTNTYIPFIGYGIQYIQSYFGLVSIVALGAILESYEIFERKNKKAIKARYELISGDYSAFKEEDNKNEETSETSETSNENSSLDDLFKDEPKANKNEEEDEPLFKEENNEETEEYGDDKEKPIQKSNNNVETKEEDSSFNYSENEESLDDILNTIKNDKAVNVAKKKEEENIETNIKKNELVDTFKDERETEGIKVSSSVEKTKKHDIRLKIFKDNQTMQNKKEKKERKYTIKRLNR